MFFPLRNLNIRQDLRISQGSNIRIFYKKKMEVLEPRLASQTPLSCSQVELKVAILLLEDSHMKGNPLLLSISLILVDHTAVLKGHQEEDRVEA